MTLQYVFSISAVRMFWFESRMPYLTIDYSFVSSHTN